MYESVNVDQVEMNFFSCSIEGFARWYLMIGDEAIIIKPERLKDKVKSLISALMSNLYDTPVAAF
ncbi:MAG: hypothetical protein H7Y07_13535 [Pyrinomonadaceae bacterium]|nr:hypothetical protein [Sphingobacteriaceae bacterium]